MRLLSSQCAAERAKWKIAIPKLWAVTWRVTALQGTLMSVRHPLTLSSADRTAGCGQEEEHPMLYQCLFLSPCLMSQPLLLITKDLSHVTSQADSSWYSSNPLLHPHLIQTVTKTPLGFPQVTDLRDFRDFAGLFSGRI